MRKVWATWWEGALLAGEGDKLGYTPVGIDREMVSVAIVRDSEVVLVAIARKVVPAAQGKAAPILVGAVPSTGKSRMPTHVSNSMGR